MKRILPVVLAAVVVFAFAGPSSAGGKANGASCHVHKSCQSKLCVRLQPEDKFGVCCAPTSCAAESAQCGEISDGCGTPLNCGTCDPGSTCTSNQCVAGTTTTTTSTTTTTAGPAPCDNCPLPDGPVVCDVQQDCFLLHGTEQTACETTCVHNDQCGNLSPCAGADDCAQGQICVTNNCCGTAGLCVTPCIPPSTTTTTSSTSTTLAGLPRSCVGNCVYGFPPLQDRVVPPGTGPDCYCDEGACGYYNGDGCADFGTACNTNPIFVCD